LTEDEKLTKMLTKWHNKPPYRNSPWKTRYLICKHSVYKIHKIQPRLSGVINICHLAECNIPLDTQRAILEMKLSRQPSGQLLVTTLKKLRGNKTHTQKTQKMPMPTSFVTEPINNKQVHQHH